MNIQRPIELEDVIKDNFQDPQKMNREVVIWFRNHGILKGKQRFEEIRIEPLTNAALDRGLGDAQITARLILDWIKQKNNHLTKSKMTL